MEPACPLRRVPLVLTLLLERLLRGLLPVAFRLLRAFHAFLPVLGGRLSAYSAQEKSGAPARAPTHRKVPQTLPSSSPSPSWASPGRGSQIAARNSIRETRGGGTRAAARRSAAPPGGRSPLGGESGSFDARTGRRRCLRPERTGIPARNDRGRRTVLRRQSSAPSCRSHVSVEQPVDAMRARFQPQRPERPDHGVARQSRSATIPAARPFFATIQKPSRKMTASTSGQSCPGRTAKCVGSERTRS